MAKLEKLTEQYASTDGTVMSSGADLSDVTRKVNEIIDVLNAQPTESEEKL
jgi:xylose isomerase